jgi:hypothetical protein
LKDSAESTIVHDANGSGIGPVFVAGAISALLGIGGAVLMTSISPGDKFSWAGLAVAPLWLLLEIVFEFNVGMFGARSRLARIVATTTLLLGFYVTWFAIRPL